MGRESRNMLLVTVHLPHADLMMLDLFVMMNLFPHRSEAIRYFVKKGLHEMMTNLRGFVKSLHGDEKSKNDDSGDFITQLSDLFSRIDLLKQEIIDGRTITSRDLVLMLLDDDEATAK